MLNRLLITLPRPSLRPLATPLELPQDFPDVAFVVMDSKLLLDQVPDPPQSPQWRLVAQSFRSLQQALLQPLQVLPAQTRLAPGPTCLLQPFPPLLGQRLGPAVHTGMAHAQPPADFGLAQSLPQQPHPLQAASLQSLKVSVYSFWVSHAGLDASEIPLVALYYANLNISLSLTARARTQGAAGSRAPSGAASGCRCFREKGESAPVPLRNPGTPSGK